MNSTLRLIASSFLAIFILGLFPLRAQTTIWSDNFNNGCAANCLITTYGGWTMIDNDGGVTGGAPNDWFVSCAEEGVVPPGCGSSCIGDASLHIGANPGAGGDLGASFNETGASNATFRLAVSPTINTTGYSGITLAFDYIAFGSAACADDRAQLRLSTDNGATWPVGFQYCLTSVCCGACNGYSQGQWTIYTLALPAAFDNNPNVRVGFHWRNNGNGSGTDPSVAIDDVRMTTLVLPVELMSFKGREKDKVVFLNWTATSENHFDRYEIERSQDANSFKTIGTVSSRGSNTKGIYNYNYEDRSSFSATSYYRLKMVDKNGMMNYSNIVRVVAGSNSALELTSLTPIASDHSLDLQLWSMEEMRVMIEVYDLNGNMLYHLNRQKIIAGENSLNFSTPKLASGVYMVRIKSEGKIEGYDPVNIVQKFVLTKNL